MSKIRTILMGALAVFSMAAPAAYANKVWVGGSSLDLRVGPGINATFSNGTMRGSCSDNGHCRFDVALNSTFDIIARGRAGQAYRWTGCNIQAERARCRVEVREDQVRVTVR